MRIFVSLFLLSLVTGAQAFDSADWHGRRELLTREAERLRTAYSNCIAKVQTPAQDVSVPIEVYEDGSIKVIVYAKKAQYFLDKGLVWAKDVEVKKFDRKGNPDSQIRASECLVDRFSKSGWAEGPASFTHGRTTFKGNGIYFSSEESYVKVFDEADIVSSDLKFGGVSP